MFKIGDFSRLTQVPIRTLRHYDEIGLFAPASVDAFTGYRYYTFDQLPRLNRILALRGLGFTLEQVRQMMDDGDSPNADALRGMLTLRQAQLQQQVQDSLDKLAQVERRLQQIEREGKMPDVEILTKQVEGFTVAGAREVVTQPSNMRERCITLNDQACDLIRAANLKTDGVSFTLYYSTDAPGVDVEMAYAVEPARPVASEGNAQVHALPATTVAYAVYRGSYDDFGAVVGVYQQLGDWIRANGYQISGPCREYYLRPPQGPDDRVGVMEIQYPIERA